ncbi:hypothetical protein DIE12_03235 [Burkholderia sp. Bp9015]|nr:hypothetical protein DIE12_03235 [Burkholderia sp. Bp9015]
MNWQAQALLNRTETLNPDTQEEPIALDGDESWSFKNAGGWAKAKLSTVAIFVLTICEIAWVTGVVGVARTLRALMLDHPIDVENFGVVGDGVAADSAALQRALNWLTAGNERRLFIKGGFVVRIDAPVVADFTGLARAGELMVHGAIQPDPGIGHAITFLNMRGGRVHGRVYGGGQTADYTQADPVGADEAYRFVNVYGTKIHVEGGNYAGRMMRITSDAANIGPDCFKTQWVLVEGVKCNSTAKITDPEPTRLAQGVGQAFFIDTGTNAFGSINTVTLAWDLYGPVLEKTTDVKLHDMETLWRGLTGMEIRACLSFWGGKINLGSELPTGTMQLLRILSKDGVDCQNVSIDELFLVGGNDGLYAENVGNTSGQGMTAGKITTRLNRNIGITLNNCKKFEVGTNQYADGVNLRLMGACSDGILHFRSTQSKKQNIVIDAEVSGQVRFKGSATNGNANGAAGIALIENNSLNPIFFEDFLASSGDVDYLYKLQPSNGTRLKHGSVVTSGATQVFNTQPNRATGVRGLVTMNAGTVTIAAGATSGSAAHGMPRTPDYAFPGAKSAGGVDAYVTADNQYVTVSLTSAAPSALTVNWVAWLNYGI